MDAQCPLKTTKSNSKMLMVTWASDNMLKSYDIIIIFSLLLNYFIIYEIHNIPCHIDKSIHETKHK